MLASIRSSSPSSARRAADTASGLLRNVKVRLSSKGASQVLLLSAPPSRRECYVRSSLRQAGDHGSPTWVQRPVAAVPLSGAETLVEVPAGRDAAHVAVRLVERKGEQERFRVHRRRHLLGQAGGAPLLVEHPGELEEALEPRRALRLPEA